MDDTIYLGYELEVEANEDLLREADRWVDEDEEDPCNEAASWVNQRLGYTYVKHDGSLDCGMEIVSHPATLSYHLSKQDKIGELFSAMISEGWRSHDTSTCGLHVHFSIAAVENKNPFAVHNLLILVNRFWPYMVKFSRRSESQLNHWAKRYLTNRVPYERLKDFVKSDADRRMAVNLMNDSTVEIRIFRGTLNINTFIATLQFVQTLIDKCIDLGSDPDAVQRITWNQLVESDYAELNAYLEARGLLNVDDPSDPIPEPVKRQTSSSNRSFNVGDRVLFRHPGVYASFYNSDMPFDFTAEGEIVVIRDSDYGVRFDIDHEQSYLHRLGGAIDGAYGQYCLAEDLTPVDHDSP